jgi:glycerol-3-phosphate dehydrogenase (NAD(P)+)
MTRTTTTTILGAGAWGTAFALQLAGRGRDVALWVYEPDLVRDMAATGENTTYLPGFTLPPSIHPTSDLASAVAASDDVVVATPSFAFRRTLEQVAGALAGKRLCILTKGLESEGLLRMSEVAAALTGGSCAIAGLSGPSFAVEVARHSFTSVVVAATDDALARHFQDMCHDARFRVYRTRDVVGVELGGAMKNVMAIGAGVIQGLGLGYNAQAAYITRALAEIKRLGRRLAARDTTFMGLSGVGDLILTCTGPLSRNRTFGVELARGRDPRDIIASQKTVVEGYYTVDAAYRFSKTLHIDMPITEELYRIVYGGKKIDSSFEDIRNRGSKEEDV